MYQVPVRVLDDVVDVEPHAIQAFVACRSSRVQSELAEGATASANGAHSFGDHRHRD
jgi:hypothetical protein